MKIGLSTYSLKGAFRDGRLDMPGIVRTIAEWGGEHVEVAPLPDGGFTEHPEVAKAVKAESERCNIPLSSYTFAANFLLGGADNHELSAEDRKTEIRRVKQHIDIAAELGVKIVRHDVGHRPVENTATAQFDLDLPVVAEACAEVADYAKQYGICTNLENHGRHFQGSERVRRLVEAVNRSNFSCFIDVGNCIGVDEDPYSAALNNIDIATMFHFKDNFRRTRVPDPENWHITKHGNFYRGAIAGYGDIDLFKIAELIRKKGFDGFISIEFECPDVDCLYGARRSLENVKRMFGKSSGNVIGLC